MQCPTIITLFLLHVDDLNILVCPRFGIRVKVRRRSRVFIKIFGSDQLKFFVIFDQNRWHVKCISDQIVPEDDLSKL